MSARDDYPLLTLVPGASDPIGRQTWRQGLAALDEIDRLRAALAERDRYIAIQEGITS